VLPQHFGKVQNVMLVNDKLRTVLIRNRQTQTSADINGRDELFLQLEAYLVARRLQTPSAELDQLDADLRRDEDPRRSTQKNPLALDMCRPRVALIQVLQIAADLYAASSPDALFEQLRYIVKHRHTFPALGITDG